MTEFRSSTRARPIALRIAAVCFAAAAPAAAQSQVWKVFGTTTAAGGTFGNDFDALDDVDGDGVVDLVVGTPGETASFTSEGSVTLMSGRDGSTIWKSYGGLKDAALGRGVKRMSDLDGDRIRDFITWYQDLVANQVVLSMRSGATGTVLWERRDPRVIWAAMFARAGDVDGDGFDDVVAQIASDRVAVLSGRVGNVVLDLPVHGLYVSSFTSLAGGGDVDGDGVPDLIVTDSEYQAARHFVPGAAWVFSGADGQVLYRFIGTRDRAQYGQAATILGDLDGDGYAEFAIGAPWDDRLSWGQGWAEVRSGKDGSLRAWHASTFPTPGLKSFGWNIEGVGDVNRDGVDDYTVSSLGAVFLYSGRDDYRLYHYENLGAYYGPDFGWHVVSMGDVDGDGRPDLAISDPLESPSKLSLNVGSISVWGTREVMTDASPRGVYSGNPFVVMVGQDQPALPFGIALVEVDGTATFTLLASGSLDGTGRGYYAAYLPYGMKGMTFTYRGFVVDATGHLIVTEPDTIVGI